MRSGQRIFPRFSTVKPIFESRERALCLVHSFAALRPHLLRHARDKRPLEIET